MNPDDYRDGLDASSSPWNDGDGGGGDDDDDASSLPPREAHDGKKIPRVFAGWRLHILPPRRQQRRPRERRGSSRFDDHDAFTPLSRGAAARAPRPGHLSIARANRSLYVYYTFMRRLGIKLVALAAGLRPCAHGLAHA